MVPREYSTGAKQKLLGISKHEKRSCIVVIDIALLLHVGRGFVVPVICLGPDLVYKKSEISVLMLHGCLYIDLM